MSDFAGSFDNARRIELCSGESSCRIRPAAVKIVVSEVAKLSLTHGARQPNRGVSSALREVRVVMLDAILVSIVSNPRGSNR